MSYAGDIAVSNTFEIVIRNNTAQRQEVQLFEQGSNNPNRILDTPITIQRQPNDISEYWDLGGKWINVSQYPEKVTFKPTFEINYGLNTGVGTTIIPVLNTPLSEVVEALNSSFKAVPLTKYFRIQLNPVVVTGRPVETRLQVNLFYYPFDPETGEVSAGYYDGDPLKLLDFIEFVNSSDPVNYPDTTLSNTNLYPLQEESVTINGSISLPDIAGIPYSQILESQSGQVLDIKSMRVDAIGSNGDGTNTPNDTISQLLEPLTFNKKDADGNALVYNKIPTIDPFQFQNTIDYINMRTKADTFALDGTTAFETGISPNTTLRLTCAYTQLTNFTAGSRIAQEIEARQEKVIEDSIKEGDSSRTYKLDLPNSVVKGLQQDNKEFDELEKKKIISNRNLSLPIQNFLWCWDWYTSHTY